MKKTALVLLVCGALGAYLCTRLCHHEQSAATTRILAEQAYRQVHKENPQGAPQIVLKGTDLYLFGKNSVQNCQIQAEKSLSFPNKRKTTCHGVQCKVTTQNRQMATLQSRKALVDHANKTIHFPQSVAGSLLSTGSGISIAAPKGTIDLKKETIRLEEGVSSVFEATV